jgi:hypothetical protein
LFTDENASNSNPEIHDNEIVFEDSEEEQSEDEEITCDEFGYMEDDPDFQIHTTSNFIQTASPVKFSSEVINFISGIQFLLKAGCSEELYREEFTRTPFYNDEYPLTLRTAKEKLFRLASTIVQVSTCMSIVHGFINVFR